MPERFHWQSPEGERQFDKQKVEDLFLALNLEKARVLARDYSLEKPKENVHSAIDISNILKDGMSWEEVVPIIREGNFEGVNIGVDQIKNAEQAEKIKAELEKYKTKIISFHGAVDPFFIGMTEKPNADMVKHDFEIAEELDPNGSAPVNYDMIAAELPDINEFQKGRKLEEIYKIQREKLAEKGIKSDKNLMEQIIKFVAENRPQGTKRPVVFETRQSIIAESPEITKENLEYFVKTCGKYFDNDGQWGLTIDVGHVVGALPREANLDNILKMREEAEKICRVLEKYKQYIKMVHASGTVMAHTLASYKLAERANMDSEAVKGWSMHQAIDNDFIVEMVKKIREIKGSDNFVEVSEVRPIHSAAKYFGDTLHFGKEQSMVVHKEQLKLQAEILGYNKE